VWVRQSNDLDTVRASLRCLPSLIAETDGEDVGALTLSRVANDPDPAQALLDWAVDTFAKWPPLEGRATCTGLLR
jgi:hypothetical protein